MIAPSTRLLLPRRGGRPATARAVPAVRGFAAWSAASGTHGVSQEFHPESRDLEHIVPEHRYNITILDGKGAPWVTPSPTPGQTWSARSPWTTARSTSSRSRCCGRSTRRSTRRNRTGPWSCSKGGPGVGGGFRPADASAGRPKMSSTLLRLGASLAERILVPGPGGHFLHRPCLPGRRIPPHGGGRAPRRRRTFPVGPQRGPYRADLAVVRRRARSASSDPCRASITPR